MKKELENSIKRVVERVRLQNEVQDEAPTLFNGKYSKLESFEKLPYIKKRIEHYKKQYEIGLLSKYEFFFHVSHTLDDYHSGLWLSEYYNEILGPISQKIHAIEKYHGLKDDEYWPIDEGPPEWIELQAEYEKQLDIQLNQLFIEFGLA